MSISILSALSADAIRKGEFTLSTRTADLVSAMHDAAEKQRVALVKNVKHDSYTSLYSETSKAVTSANKSVQSDTFDAILRTPDPLKTVCAVGVFNAYSVDVKRDAPVSVSTSSVVLDFESFIGAYNTADLPNVTPISAEWKARAVCAVKVAAVHSAGEKMVDPSTYIARLKLTRDELAYVKRDFTLPQASKKDVKTALQSAVNAIFGTDENGRARYWVNSEDVNALLDMFAWDFARNSMVVPLEQTMIKYFFCVLRHVVGGQPYGVIVKERKSESK